MGRGFRNLLSTLMADDPDAVGKAYVGGNPKSRGMQRSGHPFHLNLAPAVERISSLPTMKIGPPRAGHELLLPSLALLDLSSEIFLIAPEFFKI
jgi:hypothetical protein